MKTLLETYVEDLAAREDAAKLSSSPWSKTLSVLFQDLLPSLLIILIVSGLSLLVMEFIEQHRPNHIIVVAAKK